MRRSRLLLTIVVLFQLEVGKTWAASPAPPLAASECLNPASIEDRSGAVSRNETALTASGLCVVVDTFDEGSLHWQLLIVANRAAPRRILWVVPHDNEGDAFDSAVEGVRAYGGTIVAVKTGGRRMNGKQDPNRNFDSGGGERCPAQIARSPTYTKHVLRWWDRKAPILALHTNERGYEGDHQGGRGTISIARKTPSLVPFRSKFPIGESPDDTMIYVASRRSPQNARSLMRVVAALNSQGVNVAYERVSMTGSDCSLSNYAALAGAPHYLNFEVVQTDGRTQRRMIDIALNVLGLQPLTR